MRMSLPDAENYLVTSGLGGWEDVLRGIALVGRVCTDNLLSSARDGLEVKSPVIAVLASSIWLLVSKSETKLSVSSSDESWGGCKCSGDDGELHGDIILLITCRSRYVKDCRFLSCVKRDSRRCFVDDGSSRN